MFWRIFLTYLLLVVTAVALVGVIILRRSEGERVINESAQEVAAIVLFIAAVSVLPAYLFARRLSQPLHDLTAGAMRLGDGDLKFKVRTAGGPEFAALARTLNGMSDRLAGTFAQLEHDREQLRTILSGMVEGVVAFDTDQRVLFANERAGELLEFAPAVAVGRKLWEVTRQPAVRGIVDRALAGDGPCRDELDWTGPGAKHLGVYVSRLPVDKTGTSSGAVMVLHDTTELRRLERLRQDFVANVSHELKTPLAVIQSNIEALQDGAADEPATRGPFLDRVRMESTRLELLIQDLLRLARIESGDQYQFAPVRLDEAIAECLDRHSSRAEAMTQQFVEVPPPTGPAGVLAWADEMAVGHILDNLVDNAIKYTPNGGTITVRWAAAGNAVTVEVQDTGIGIGERDLPRVFERFYRADKARSRDQGGTGLGLAIVKHLASAMGGGVTVHSRLGKGTTFRVTLPRPADAG